MSVSNITLSIIFVDGAETSPAVVREIAEELFEARAEIARLKSAPDAIGEVERLRCRHAQELKIALPGTLAAFRAQDMLAAVDEILAALRALPIKEPARSELAERLYEHVRALGFHGPDAKLWAERSDEHKQLWLNAVDAVFLARPDEGAVVVVSDEMVERACEAFDKELFNSDLNMAHQAASPHTLDHARDVMRSDMRPALEAALRTTDGGDGWLPIATAPKDGTVVSAWPCLLEDGPSVVRAHWYKHAAVKGWITDELDCNDYDFNPTHWHPLLKPPAIKGQG